MNTDAPYWTKKAGLWSLLKYYIGWLLRAIVWGKFGQF